MSRKLDIGNLLLKLNSCAAQRPRTSPPSRCYFLLICKKRPACDLHRLVTDPITFVQLNLASLPDGFTQTLLTASIDLRESMCKTAQTQGLDIMPIIITASTRAATTDLHQTKSACSRIADIQLRPLSIGELEKQRGERFSRNTPLFPSELRNCKRRTDHLLQSVPIINLMKLSTVSADVTFCQQVMMTL